MLTERETEENQRSRHSRNNATESTSVLGERPFALRFVAIVGV